MTIASVPVPKDSLLAAYDRQPGCYTDAFVTEVAATADFACYVAAFYTTPLFRLERLILRWFASLPSTDDEAQALASGDRDRFAAWDVEARGEAELLLADVSGRTRSWLMVRRTDRGTALWFGSAVVPKVGGDATAMSGLVTRLHRGYSRALLASARARVRDRAKG